LVFDRKKKWIFAQKSFSAKMRFSMKKSLFLLRFRSGSFLAGWLENNDEKNDFDPVEFDDC